MKLKQRVKRCVSSGLIASMLFSVSGVFANTPDLLHSTQNMQTITKGATYIKDSRLTSKGWQDLHILKVDLEDPNIQVRPIESKNIGEKQTILSLVKAADAVAGVNADFFDMSQQKAPSFGVVIDNGTLKHGYNDKVVGLGASKNMGTALIDNNNKLFLNYFNVNLEIIDKQTGQKVTTISSVNKPTGNLGTPAYLDRSYGPTTIPLEGPNKRLYKILVEDGIVTKKVGPEQAANIPQGGYIIIMDEVAATKNLERFYEGQNLEFKSELILGEYFQKSIDEIQSGIGGGGLIMKDGQAYTGAAHKVSPTSRHPRTVIGSSEDGKILFLITIDGRGDSIGATHNDLIPILKSYGIYNAMHLDGGGSTTLVSREEGDSQVKVKNNPSGGSQRQVTNGIGIFSTSEKGTVSKLLISSKYEKAFVGSSVSYDIKAVDENNNPLDISKEQIKWTTEGLTGNFKGNTFYPTSPGKGLVVASINGVEVAKELLVTQEPIGLDITPSLSVLKVGQNANLTFLGIDKYGYASEIDTQQLNWSISPEIVTINQGKISAVKNGQALIKFSLKSNPNVTKTISVVVGERTRAVESFEVENPAVWGGSNLPEITGRAESCKDLKYHGNASIKFIYKLANTKNKQVAYMNLTKPITIDSNVESIGIWVYGNDQPDMLKMELSDLEGRKYALQVGETSFKGWKYMSIPIPNNIKGQLKINKLYTITVNNNMARTSTLYFDHVSVNYGTRNPDARHLKGHEKFDPLHVTLDNKRHGESYDFSVVGTTNINHYPLDARLKEKYQAV